MHSFNRGKPQSAEHTSSVQCDLKENACNEEPKLKQRKWEKCITKLAIWGAVIYINCRRPAVPVQPAAKQEMGKEALFTSAPAARCYPGCQKTQCCLLRNSMHVCSDPAVSAPRVKTCCAPCILGTVDTLHREERGGPAQEEGS